MENKQSKALSFTIATVALVQMSHGGITPALAEIGRSFTNVSDLMLSLLNVLPVLMCVPAAFVAGRILGKKVSYRTFLLVGLGLLLCGGLAAFFCNSIVEVLVMRAVFGVGLGMVVPAISDVTMAVFSDVRAKKQLALNTVTANFGSIIFQLLGGYLCMIHWRYGFLGYLLVLLPIVVVLLFMKKDDGMLQVQESSRQTAPKQRLNIHQTIKWCIVYFAYFVAFYVFVNNMSSIIVNGNLGTSGDVGLVLSVFGLGGMLGGLFYRKVLYRLNVAALIPAMLLCILGYVCTMTANSLAMLYIAAVLFGSGFGIVPPAAMYCGVTSVGEAHRSEIISYMTIANNVGGFVSAFLMALLVKVLHLTVSRSHFLIGILIFSALAIFFVLQTIIEKSKRLCKLCNKTETAFAIRKGKNA